MNASNRALHDALVTLIEAHGGEVRGRSVKIPRSAPSSSRDAETADVDELRTRSTRSTTTPPGSATAACVGVPPRRRGPARRGISGFTWAAMRSRVIPWSREPYRRAGLGGGLLEAANGGARTRCVLVVLDTHDFQGARVLREARLRALRPRRGAPHGSGQTWFKKGSGLADPIAGRRRPSTERAAAATVRVGRLDKTATTEWSTHQPRARWAARRPNA